MPDQDYMDDRLNEVDMPISPRSGIRFIPEENTLDTPPVPEQLEKRAAADEQKYGQVRFLNASTSNMPLNILLDNHITASAVEFGNVTSYVRVDDGFHTVTIASSLNPRAIFYRSPVPFVKGEPVTMVITDDVNDIDLVKVSDKGVANKGEESGCFRAANMSFEDSAFDVMFYSGDTVFSNVRFKETTFFKQAEKNTYEFFISRAANGFEREEIPVIKEKEPPYDMGISQPLYWFTVDIKPGRSYTAYIIGNLWSMDNLRVLVVENP